MNILNSVPYQLLQYAGSGSEGPTGSAFPTAGSSSPQQFRLRHSESLPSDRSQTTPQRSGEVAVMFFRPACTCAKPHFPHPSVGPWLRQLLNPYTIPHSQDVPDVQSSGQPSVSLSSCRAKMASFNHFVRQVLGLASPSFSYPLAPLLGSMRKKEQPTAKARGQTSFCRSPDLLFPFKQHNSCFQRYNSGTTHIQNTKTLLSSTISWLYVTLTKQT